LADDSRRDPIEQWMEIFVYAPVGFILEAHRLWPEAVARGRREVEGSRDRIERSLKGAVTEAEAALRGLGLLGQDHQSAPEPSGDDDDADVPAPVTRLPVMPERESVTPSPDDAMVDVDALAIPGYDSLSASQVVPRLAGLEPDELELVRRYELANRGRKTILGRIAQLQDG
jgi:hypothetical protein